MGPSSATGSLRSSITISQSMLVRLCLILTEFDDRLCAPKFVVGHILLVFAANSLAY